MSRSPGEIRRAIAEGEAKPGERLPPAKDLAAVLGVNTNTVLRALRVLRDEGLLEFRRGRGVSVAGTPERGAVIARAKELVDFARVQGYRLDELVKIIEDVGQRATARRREDPRLGQCSRMSPESVSRNVCGWSLRR